MPQHPLPTPEEKALAEAYLDAQSSYVSAVHWGLEMDCGHGKKGKARPANPSGNPCPDTDHYGGLRRIPRRRTIKRIIQHLRGERAIFDVARPDRRTVYMSLDIDGQPEANIELAKAWAREQFAAVLPTATPFIEFSRSGTGLNVRFGLEYPPATDGPARRRCEAELNRRFSEAFAGPPAGFTYDMLVGTTTYKADNPGYDPIAARSIAPRAVKRTALIRLEPGEDEIAFGLSGLAHGIIPAAERDGATWIRAEHAKKIADLIPGIMDRPQVKDWSAITQAEAYARHRTYYGIKNGAVDPSVKFQRQPELEEHIIKHGQLGTSPCFGCWRGDRPDTLLDWLTWFAAGDGVVAAADLLEAIGTAWLTEPTPAPKPKPAPAKPSTADPGTGIDWTTLLDPHADRWTRYVAAGRIARREHPDDYAAAVDRCLVLFEIDGGPSDGPRHDERIERAGRVINYADQTFDLTQAGSAGVWFSERDMLKIRKRLRGAISRHDLGQARTRQRRGPDGRYRARRITYDMMAWTCCYLIKNACTGNRGEVPTRSIRRGLEARGYRGVNGSTATAMLNLLTDHGLIYWTDYARHHEGQCRKLVLVGKIMRPDWAEAAIADDVWRPRLPGHEVFSRSLRDAYARGLQGMDAIAAATEASQPPAAGTTAHAPTTPPPDKSMGYTLEPTPYMHKLEAVGKGPGSLPAWLKAKAAAVFGGKAA